MKYPNVAAITVLAAIGAVSGYAAAENRAMPPQAQQQAPANGSVTATDRNFMMKAAGGGIAEVELGKLAVEKGSSPEVKQHAQHMIDDHTKANDELKSIASSKGVTLPEQPDPKHEALIRKLQGMSGKQFDKTYMREAGLNAHREMRTLFQNEISRGQDAEVKAFAQKTLPVVETHLNHSQQIVQKEGGSANARRGGMPSASHRTKGHPSTSASRHMNHPGA